MRIEAVVIIMPFLMLTSLLLAGMGGGQKEPLADATYRVDFNSTWSATTHPDDFPDRPHFSGLIGVTHNSSVNIWQTGQLASPGIKKMAETGGKDPLNTEIDQLIAGGNAGVKMSGGGIGTSPGTVSLNFTVSSDYPLVSLVSMIAPSPDWFVGVSSLDLREDGVWIDSITIDLYPYDAGTDSGTIYSSANSVTNPAQVMYRIAGDPFLHNQTVARLGTFTFTRL